ncbi:MAG: hypothetical protein N2115_01845 [bacterium]|nr:hypothetical protein [bacterium]
MKFFQEKIYSFEWKNNGAGPLWCFGSSCIASIDDRVFVTGWETLKDIPPLNCARWMLYERKNNRWERLYTDNEKTREPAPICVLSDGKIFVSENPFMLEKEAYMGLTLPKFSFSLPPDYRNRKNVLFYPCEPVTFIEHSYRNFAADRENSELILFQNKDYDRAYWSLIDEWGNTIKNGKIYWPWGYDYVNPQPIRLCYNNVLLKNRAVYIFGTSDIIEPNPEWRKYKRELTGRQWDYDFRRVFFTFTPDIINEPFRNWVEISSREKTAGKSRNCDLYVDKEGFIHLLWMEKSCDERLREKFFPDEPLTRSLKYAKLKDQTILIKKDILFLDEGEKKLSSGPLFWGGIWGRFHITEENRLYIFASIISDDVNNKNKIVAENFLIELDNQGNIKGNYPVNFEKPFTEFHTSSIRNGCAPSNTIHIYGSVVQSDNEMYYGRIDIQG